MRKIISFAFIALLYPFIAAEKLNAQSIELGNSVFSVGIGAPNIQKAAFKKLYAGNDELSLESKGPAHLKYEYLLTKRFSIGVSINLSSASVHYVGYQKSIDPNGQIISTHTDYNVSTTGYSILGRLNFHFITTEKADFYIGTALGYKNVKYTYTSNPLDTRFGNSTVQGFPIGVEATLGFRYFVMQNIAIYAEAGLAMSVIQGGLCFKL